MDIFQCINKKKSNVHCNYKICKNNYDGICVNDAIMNKHKNSFYVLLEDCNDPYEEPDSYYDMYWDE